MEARKVTANRGVRVLVLDDEEYIRKVVGKMLRALGYDVDFATNGSDAVEKYAQSLSGEAYELVILDCEIPNGMGGKEAHHEMARLNPGIRAIISSGKRKNLDGLDDNGFLAVLPKPYTLAELERAISRVSG
ncbi:MAG: response regulator [Promethearchaeota archaeon]